LSLFFLAVLCFSVSHYLASSECSFCVLVPAALLLHCNVICRPTCYDGLNDDDDDDDDGNQSIYQSISDLKVA